MTQLADFSRELPPQGRLGNAHPQCSAPQPKTGNIACYWGAPPLLERCVGAVEFARVALGLTQSYAR